MQSITLPEVVYIKNPYDRKKVSINALDSINKVIHNRHLHSISTSAYFILIKKKKYYQQVISNCDKEIFNIEQYTFKFGG